MPAEARGGSPSKIRRLAKRAVGAAGRRLPAIRRLTRALRAERRRAAYRAHVRANPVEDRTVLFESYVGSGYSCSPKALYQAMLRDRRFDGHTLIWALKRPEDYLQETELARATLVEWGSPEYFAAYARAKYWICNCAVPVEVSPREGQVYVQTWHGTPLKRFGCDITPAGIRTECAVEERLQRWRVSAAKFTWLLSQSPFASEKLASALGLDPASAPHVICELGYPRNDFLSTFEDSDVERIKSRLGLSGDKRIVLYAPTWRDDQRTAGVGYNLQIELDFDRLRERLGDGYVVLFRAHFMIADAFDFACHQGFVRDVSKVDDVNDLYVVSDVLVTDYSSVFFDYADLERPVVFYMYDLDRYAAGRGGFYLNLDELPGPIVRDQDDLASAIRAACDARTDTDAGMRYRAFRERFAPLDDGHAGERVLDRVFGVKEEDWQSR